MSRVIGMLVGLAVLSGCGRQKELPPKVHVTTEEVAAPVVAVPAASEPEAMKFVERALTAATEGHPERIGKLKANRVTLKGSVVYPRPGGVPAIVPTFRRIEAVWPDRIFLADEFNENGAVRLTIGLRKPVLWMRRRSGTDAPVSADPPDPPKYAEAFAADAVGRHWMPLLVPLTDPKTIVFGAKKQTINGQVADVIKASVPGCPVFTLLFDEKSGILGRVDFTHQEPTAPSPTAKVFHLAAHKAVDGVIVPMKIDYRQNTLVVEEWTVDAWEWVDKIEDATFDPPK